MTGARRPEFYVTISAEAKEAGLVADIVFDADHFASAVRVGELWMLTVYDTSGDGQRQLPLAGLLEALHDAEQRLGSR